MHNIDLTIPSFLLRAKGVETMLPIGEAARVVLAAVKDKRKPKADRLPVPPPRVARSESPPTQPEQPQTKTQLVAGLLKRPEGCTTADILAATGWPSVSVPAMAKAAGLRLEKEKTGKVTRYYGV